MSVQLTVKGQIIQATDVMDIFWEDAEGAEVHWTDNDKSSWRDVKYFYMETDENMLEVEVTKLDADTLDYIDRMVNPL